MSDKPKRTYTNMLGLPEPIVRAVTNDPYDAEADFSVTGLIKPPRVLALERQHAAEIVEDVADRLWALIGQVGHTILERAGTGLVEKRLRMRRDVFHPLGPARSISISGRIDLLEPATIVDYKFTSIWTTKNGIKPEWEQQLNLYALLCREHGLPVESAEIIAIYRDWSVGEARRDKNYPQRQVHRMPLLLWKPELQEQFLRTRILLHLSAEANLPECTDDERWARPEQWAVMKKGNQKANKLHYSYANALEDVEQRGAGFSVERRPGVQVRCLDYCAAAPFCRQFEMLDPANYQSMLAAKRPILA